MDNESVKIKIHAGFPVNKYRKLKTKACGGFSTNEPNTLGLISIITLFFKNISKLILIILFLPLILLSALDAYLDDMSSNLNVGT